VAGCCVHDNIPSGSIGFWEILDSGTVVSSKRTMLHGVSGTVLDGKGQFVAPDGKISDNTLMKSIYLMIIVGFVIPVVFINKLDWSVYIYIYIYLFIYCNWVVTRWQWLFYM